MSNTNLLRYSFTSFVLFSGGLLFFTVGCQSTNVFQRNHATTSRWPGGPASVSDDHKLCNDECNRPYDFGPSAVPPPPGTYVNAWNGALISSARESRYVVNRHEWYSGGAELGPSGRNHVSAIANSLCNNYHPVFIEAEEVIPERNESLEEAYSRIEQLNNQRRAIVVMQLQSQGVGHANELVKVATTDAVGVYGIEAPRIFNNLLQGTGGAGRGNGNRNGSLNGSGGNSNGRGAGLGF